MTPLIPDGVDRNRVLAFLKQYEGGLIEGASETARRQAAKTKAEAAAKG